jgi:hypothetical protein
VTATVPVSYRAVGSIVVADIDGCVSLDEVRGDLLSVITDQVHLGGVSALIDLRAVTPLSSSTNLRSLAAEIRKLNPSESQQRCAILVESEALFGLMLHEAYSDGASIDMRAFRDRADAVDWLNPRREV